MRERCDESERISLPKIFCVKRECFVVLKVVHFQLHLAMMNMENCLSCCLDHHHHRRRRRQHFKE